MTDSSAFRIVIVYENITAGIRAKEISERLAARLRPEFDLNSEVWKFELLDHPFVREKAAHHATEADMIIISARAKAELPAHVRTWIESWLPSKKDSHAALVALLNQDREAPWETPVLRDYLRETAEQGRMDFFCETDWRQQDFDDIVETSRQLPEHSSFLPSNVMQEPAWQRWGINE